MDKKYIFYLLTGDKTYIGSSFLRFINSFFLFLCQGIIMDYENYCIGQLENKFKAYYGNLDIDIAQVKQDEADINAYPNLDKLEPISEERVIILDKEDTLPAEKAIIEGRFFWEHACAGEATRLGLGTKFLQDPSKFDAGFLREHLKDVMPDDKLASFLSDLPKLRDLTLGSRHMMQMAYDVKRIAEKHGDDPDTVLKRQHTLVIVNEQSSQQVIDEFKKHDLYGLDPDKVFFMVQKSFHGIDIVDGKLQFVDGDNKRLHNHGQMVMQKAEEGMFTVDGPVSKERFREILEHHDDLLSFNIEDLGYLTGSVDLESLSLALRLGKEGYDMVMEVVAQDPDNPIKGGACFYDPVLERPVMIESFQLKGIKNEDIKHLNKNFNHYPNPVESFRMLEKGLPMPFTIKTMDGKDYIYPCPVQGDMNFLVKTAYVMRKVPQPIKAWKSAKNTPDLIRACKKQDELHG